MAFTIRTLPRAEFDAQEIYDWIKERSPEGASRWWLAFEGDCDRLADEADGFSLAPEAEGAGRDVRQILFKAPHGRYYRALYVVLGEEVQVLRVRGLGQPDLPPDEIA